MAVETSNKRKRGRMLNASTMQQPVARGDGNDNNDAEDSARPRKRRRPAQNEKTIGASATHAAGVTETMTDQSETRATRRRPVHPTNGDAALTGTKSADDGTAKRSGRLLRGRARAVANAIETNGEEESAVRKRSGRQKAATVVSGRKDATMRALQDSASPNMSGHKQTIEEPPRRKGRPPRNATSSADANRIPMAVSSQQTRVPRGEALDEAETDAPSRRKRSRLAPLQNGLSVPAAQGRRPALPAADNDLSANVKVANQRKNKKRTETAQPNPPAIVEEDERRRAGRRPHGERSLREAVYPPNAQDNDANDAISWPIKRKERRRPRDAPEADENEPAANGAQLDKPSGKNKPTASKQPKNPHHTDGMQPSTASFRAAPEVADELSPPRRYRYLEERIRYVPCSTVNDEWNPLKPSSIASVREILANAERTVFESVKDTQNRREHVGAALTAVSNRLMRKIHQVPFPPAVAIPKGLNRRGKSARIGTTGDSGEDATDDGRDAGRGDELRFEAVLYAADALERRLDPLPHAVRLLEKEKRSLAVDIERQRKRLEQLRTATKDDSAFWRERLHNAHRLAPYPRPVLEEEDGDEVEADEPGSLPAFVTDDTVGTLYSALQQDDDLRTLAGQLSSHVESMRVNARQVDGIVPAIAQSSAALRAVLLQNLDRNQYDKALFG